MKKKRIKIGIIGMGRRGLSMALNITSFSDQNDLSVTALCNRNEERLSEAHNLFHPDIALYTNYMDLIKDKNVDLVMITTPQYAHKDPAVAVLQSGKKLFLDKPLAHNIEDAMAIAQVEKETNNRMIMGFTRRYEKIWLKMFELLKENTIGELRMMLIRTVVPYHIYFHTWHRRREWSGGVIGDKSSHLFDVFNWFSGLYPEKVSAIGARSVFKPDPDAPARCRECSRDCPYRMGEKTDVKRQDAMESSGTSWANEKEVIRRDDNCVYLPGADINDQGVVTFQFPKQIMATLFWTVFGPDADNQETFEIVGTTGRMILIRHKGIIDLVTDYGKKQVIIDIKEKDFEGTHFGADERLLQDIQNFYNGAEPVVSGKDGLEADRMVAAVHLSADSGGRIVDMKEIATL